MTDSEVLAAINDSNGKVKSGLNAWLLLGLSLVVFTAMGVLQWSFVYMLLLVVAIFLHETGHLLAMKIYGYKNLKMLFVPFLGGAATGESQEQNAYKIAMISIFGPFIGLLSCVAALVCWKYYRLDFLLMYARLALAVNVFNLLPILPLDGGHFWNEVAFNRSPKAEVVFRILAIISFGLLAYKFKAWLFAILAFSIAFTLELNYRMAQAIVRLRRSGEMEGNELTGEKVAAIRRELKSVSPHYENDRNLKQLPLRVAGMWAKTNKVFPSIFVTTLLIFTYIMITFGLSGFTWAAIQGFSPARISNRLQVGHPSP